MATLNRQQLLQTWQGLQGLIKGVPSELVPTTSVEGLSDDALRAYIDSQLTSIDNNANVGRAPSVDPNGPVPDLSQPSAAATGARTYAINTIKTALTDPSGVDMGRFHALITAYAEGHELTIPDLANDSIITDSERKAAEEIVRRLEANENAPEIRAAFGTQAKTLAEQQRVAQAAEAARLEAERTAAIQQDNLENAVDAHLASLGYIQPGQIGKLNDNQRANHLTQFIKDNELELGIGTLGTQQQDAINFADAKIKPGALKVLAAGRRGDHMGEEVKQWLENGANSNDPLQIMMAQATLGVQVTGTLDAVTHASAEAYIKAPYATSLSDNPGLLNSTGAVSPSQAWDAANEGRLYTPSIEELRAAGVDEARLAMIEAARPAAELVPLRAALNDKPFEEFTDTDRAVWVADTREELIANTYLAHPEVYNKVITARNEIAANTTLAVAPPVDVKAAATALPVVDVAPEDATPLEENAAANNPLDLRATNPDILGGTSLAGGNAYNNAADGKTADGTLTFKGPDTSLQMVVDHIRPAEGALTMEDALYRVHYLQTTEQEAFLGGAMGSGGPPSGSYAGRIAIELGYEPDHKFDFNDPKQLNDLLTGVVASTNYASLPGEGNILKRFQNSDDPAVVSMRNSIERVAIGEPLLTDQPVDTTPANDESTTPIGIPTSELNADGTPKDTAFFQAPTSGKTTITTGRDGFGNAVTPAEIEEQETRVAGIATPRISNGLHIG